MSETTSHDPIPLEDKLDALYREYTLEQILLALAHVLDWHAWEDMDGRFAYGLTEEAQRDARAVRGALGECSWRAARRYEDRVGDPDGSKPEAPWRKSDATKPAHQPIVEVYPGQVREALGRRFTILTNDRFLGVPESSTKIVIEGETRERWIPEPVVRLFSTYVSGPSNEDDYAKWLQG